MSDSKQLDQLPTKAIAGVAVGALLIFALGVYLTNGMRERQLDRLQRRAGFAAYPAKVGESKIGIVEQNPFALQHRWEDQKAALLERRDSYGWVDAQKGIIHIPVAEAMQQLMAEQGK